MKEIYIEDVSDAQLNLDKSIKINLKESEAIFMVKADIKRFAEKYPDKWKEIREIVFSEIINYFI